MVHYAFGVVDIRSGLAWAGLCEQVLAQAFAWELRIPAALRCGPRVGLSGIAYSEDTAFPTARELFDAIPRRFQHSDGGYFDRDRSKAAISFSSIGISTRVIAPFWFPTAR
jgi:hypothetical protein